MQEKKLSKGWLIALCLGALLLLVGGSYIHMSNSLRSQQQAVKAQYSNIDTAMQRRYDLVPQLVGAVKGSMHNEQKIFGQIAAARQQYAAAKTPKDQTKADQELGKSTNILINAIHENYPQLASNENVQTLMTQIEGSENRIHQERRTYNEQVQAYNTRLVRFPTSLVAHQLGLHEYDYFKGDQGITKAPTVDLE